MLFITETGQKVNKIEFFDHEELDEFLFKRKRREHGILQKFITPKGPNNRKFTASNNCKIFIINM
jgi:hypothetical protein